MAGEDGLLQSCDRSILSAALGRTRSGQRGAWGPLAARAPEPLCAGPCAPGASPALCGARVPRRARLPAALFPQPGGLGIAMPREAASSPSPDQASVPSPPRPGERRLGIVFASSAHSSGGLRCERRRRLVWGRRVARGTGEETGSVSFPCITNAVCFLVSVQRSSPCRTWWSCGRQKKGNSCCPLR